MSLKTKALVLTTIGGPFELQDVNLEMMQSDEVLVEIHATGICHTDLSCSSGVLPCETPAVLGHEGSPFTVAGLSLGCLLTSNRCWRRT